MNESQNTDLVRSRPVIELLTVANEYCLFFEKADQYSREDILDYFRKIAPLLYLKGSMIPEVVPSDESLSERFVNEEQWEAVFKTLRGKFGEVDVFYHLDPNGDSVEASLADQMADVYQDLKDFVMLYQKAPARENALAEVRALFAHRWGIRLLHAGTACHRLVFREEAGPDPYEDLDTQPF
jgi:hypothetical protein